jgi:outer membrane protein assembly factor BamD (BamD/ComL family)
MRKIWKRFSVPTASALVLSMVVCSGCARLQNSAKSIAQGFKRGKTNVAEPDPLDPLGSRNTNRLVWDDFSPSQIGTTLKTRLNAGEDKTIAENAYNEGKQLYQQDGDQHEAVFVKAANKFRTAESLWPDSSLGEDALFYQGESYFFANRYVQSNRAYEGLISQYSGTRYLDRAEQRRYSIAIYWLDLKKSGAPILAINDPKRPKVSLASEARRILHRIRIDDPSGKLADDATFALGSAYMAINQHEDAAETFSYLRKDYPGSEYQFRSQMLELESRLKSYRGPDYDGLPLVEADKLRKQIVAQFPDQSQEHIDILNQQSSLIKNQLAQRDVQIGEFYESKGQNLAAKIYYEKAQADHADTIFENDLSERITAVASKPATPTPPAQWLTRIFPDGTPEKPILSAAGETIIR